MPCLHYTLSGPECRCVRGADLGGVFSRPIQQHLPTPLAPCARFLQAEALGQELSSGGGDPECTEHPLALLDPPEALLVFPLCPFAVCLLWGQGRGSCMAHRHLLTFASGARVLTVVKRQLKQAWTENALQPPTPLRVSWILPLSIRMVLLGPGR